MWLPVGSSNVIDVAIAGGSPKNEDIIIAL